MEKMKNKAELIERLVDYALRLALTHYTYITRESIRKDIKEIMEEIKEGFENGKDDAEKCAYCDVINGDSNRSCYPKMDMLFKRMLRDTGCKDNDEKEN